MPSSPLEQVAEKVAQLNKNQKLAILGGMLLLITTAYMMLFFLPQRKEFADLSLKLAKTKEEMEAVEATAAGIDKFRADKAETEWAFEQALSRLPDKKEIPGLLSSISQAGSQCGLEFMLFRPKEEVPQQFYAEIPVEIKVLGGYHDVARFFDAVSKLPRIVNISGLKMGEPKEKDNGDIVVNAECLATTYKFIESANETPQGTEKPKKP
ncbi:MAG: type 4a pilus biogenesis protein PilO [Pseudomonadota bacterium]